jgi:hypothetical protein
MRRNKEAAAMVDWTILSPTFLTAVVEWAGAAVTMLGRQNKVSNGEQR